MIGIDHGEVYGRRNLRKEQRESRRSARKKLRSKERGKVEAKLELIRSQLTGYAHALAAGAEDSYDYGDGYYSIEIIGIQGSFFKDNPHLYRVYALILKELVSDMLPARSRYTTDIIRLSSGTMNLVATLRIHRLGRKRAK